jgi:hypothetical protein
MPARTLAGTIEGAPRRLKQLLASLAQAADFAAPSYSTRSREQMIFSWRRDRQMNYFAVDRSAYEALLSALERS